MNRLQRAAYSRYIFCTNGQRLRNDVTAARQASGGTPAPIPHYLRNKDF